MMPRDLINRDPGATVVLEGPQVAEFAAFLESTGQQLMPSCPGEDFLRYIRYDYLSHAKRIVGYARPFAPLTLHDFDDREVIDVELLGYAFGRRWRAEYTEESFYATERARQ